MRFGIGGMIGNTQRKINWIHINDAARFIDESIKTKKYYGAYNLTNKEEITQKEIFNAIKNKLFPYAVIIKIPKIIIKIILGERSLIITNDIVVSNEKLKEVGFKWKYKICSYLLIYLSFSLISLHALEKKQITNKDELVDKLETLNWYNITNGKDHNIDISKANAKVQVYDNEYYLKGYKDINQFYWWKFGEGVDPSSIFFLQGDNYSIYAYYIEDGYVKLDDWKNIKAKDLLNQLKQSAKSNESYYKEKNLNYATGFEWVFDPDLNQQNRSVSYSYKVFWSDGKSTLESKNFILGKKGYIETSYIVNLDGKNINFKSCLAIIRSILVSIFIDLLESII